MASNKIVGYHVIAVKEDGFCDTFTYYDLNDLQQELTCGTFDEYEFCDEENWLADAGTAIIVKSIGALVPKRTGYTLE
jgi:hypothetical protein